LHQHLTVAIDGLSKAASENHLSYYLRSVIIALFRIQILTRHGESESCTRKTTKKCETMQVNANKNRVLPQDDASFVTNIRDEDIW
jgi:hypothetical protein